MNNKVDKDGNAIFEKAKDWPDDNGMVSFDMLVSGLRKTLQIAIDKGDKVYEDGIEWHGLNGLKNGHHPCICNIPETLHAEGLQYHKERDRDAITTILGIAVQLGMEQGAREVKQEFQKMRCAFTSDLGKQAFDLIMR